MCAFKPDAAPSAAAACATCTREASFQARVEYPPGHEFIRRRANACSSHLVEIVQTLRGWARASQLAGGMLTVLAIDPYALPRLMALGVADPGLVFYSVPISRGGGAARQAEGIHHG
jgi:hypothetical protein